MRGCVARASKKNDDADMDSDTPPNIDDLARAALRAFLRRLLTRMANEAQRDSLDFRKALEKL